MTMTTVKANVPATESGCVAMYAPTSAVPPFDEHGDAKEGAAEQHLGEVAAPEPLHDAPEHAHRLDRGGGPHRRRDPLLFLRVVHRRRERLQFVVQVAHARRFVPAVSLRHRLRV
ncbi:hypothetical protein [Haloarchaeobius iranensis]|uniref:hypothetical protein n=1 Tax=Haloarchaeobius iranensis TaxID=996166 RepID=UPI0034A2EA54